MKIGKATDNSEIHLDRKDRDRHLYVIGQTGSGKSTLFEHCIADDLAAGEGVMLIDPHGTLAEQVVRHIPHDRDDDLIYVKPSQLSVSVSLNPFHDVAPDNRPTVAGDFVGAFVDFFGESAVADRSQQVLRNSTLALLETAQPTPLAIPRLLTDEEFRSDVVLKIQDPVVRFYWTHQFAAYSDQKRDDVISPILNKLDALFAYPAIRHTLAQPTRSVNFARAIADRKIVIFNLSGLPDRADGVLGALAVSATWSAMRAANELVPLYLYIDEFPHFATRSIAAILSEARKFKLNLTLGHQFWSQVSDDIRSAVFGNVGTQIAFRVGVEDAPIIARQFERSERQLLDLPNYAAYVKPLPPGGSVRFQTEPPRVVLRDRAEPLIENSWSHFATPRGAVEQDVSALFPLTGTP